MKKSSLLVKMPGHCQELKILFNIALESSQNIVCPLVLSSSLPPSLLSFFPVLHFLPFFKIPVFFLPYYFVICCCSLVWIRGSLAETGFEFCEAEDDFDFLIIPPPANSQVLGLQSCACFTCSLFSAFPFMATLFKGTQWVWERHSFSYHMGTPPLSSVQRLVGNFKANPVLAATMATVKLQAGFKGGTDEKTQYDLSLGKWELKPQ